MEKKQSEYKHQIKIQNINEILTLHIKTGALKKEKPIPFHLNDWVGEISIPFIN